MDLTPLKEFVTSVAYTVHAFEEAYLESPPKIAPLDPTQTIDTQFRAALRDLASVADAPTRRLARESLAGLTRLDEIDLVQAHEQLATTLNGLSVVPTEADEGIVIQLDDHRLPHYNPWNGVINDMPDFDFSTEDQSKLKAFIIRKGLYRHPPAYLDLRLSEAKHLRTLLPHVAFDSPDSLPFLGLSFFLTIAWVHRFPVALFQPGDSFLNIVSIPPDPAYKDRGFARAHLFLEDAASLKVGLQQLHDHRSILPAAVMGLKVFVKGDSDQALNVQEQLLDPQVMTEHFSQGVMTEVMNLDDSAASQAQLFEFPGGVGGIIGQGWIPASAGMTNI